MLPGHLKGSGVGKFKRLQTTGIQPRHPFLHQHRQMFAARQRPQRSVRHENAAPAPGRGSESSSGTSQGHCRDAGTSAAWSVGRVDAQCPETTSTLTELPWGAQEEEEGRKDASPGTALEQEACCSLCPQGFALCNGLHSQPRDRAKPLELPLPRDT